MSDNYVGEIRLYPFNFAPMGWAVCAGQLLPISSNTTLFSLLGTYYGGDGIRTFALPNLQGSVAIHRGQGAGLSPYTIGQTGGAPTVTLLQSQMAGHNHSLNCNTENGLQAASTGAQLSKAAHAERDQPPKVGALYTPNAPNTQLAPTVLGMTGQNQPHNNMQPFLAMTYCIALSGVYPSRS